ncbi:MAG: hypothetical protein ACTSR0_01340 [Candidatus Asgardarchaeia archaeon]
MISKIQHFLFGGFTLTEEDFEKVFMEVLYSNFIGTFLIIIFIPMPLNPFLIEFTDIVSVLFSATVASIVISLGYSILGMWGLYLSLRYIKVDGEYVRGVVYGILTIFSSMLTLALLGVVYFALNSRDPHNFLSSFMKVYNLFLLIAPILGNTIRSFLFRRRKLHIKK